MDTAYFYLARSSLARRSVYDVLTSIGDIGVSVCTKARRCADSHRVCVLRKRTDGQFLILSIIYQTKLKALTYYLWSVVNGARGTCHTRYSTHQSSTHSVLGSRRRNIATDPRPNPKSVNTLNPHCGVTRRPASLAPGYERETNCNSAAEVLLKAGTACARAASGDTPAQSCASGNAQSCIHA